MHHPHGTGVAIIAAVLMLTVSAFEFQDSCPNKEVCSCTKHEIKCECDDRQLITLMSIFNFDIQSIIIRKCGLARLPLTSLINLQLNVLEIDDVHQVVISSYALAGVLGLNRLTLHNIKNLHLKPHALSGLSNVSHIKISNVTIGTLSQWTFGGVTDIGLLEITDSFIDTIEPFAFVLSNVTTMHISNTQINTVMNTSFLVHNANRLEFIDSVFNVTDNSSFSLAEIGILEFSNCSILLASGDMIFAKDVSTFIFHNCFVKSLQRKALWSIEVTEKLKFTDNNFETLEQSSLFSTIGPFGTIHGNISVDVNNNSFFCDCKIAWLWADNHLGAYKIFLDTSYCNGPSAILNVPLSRLWPKSDGDDKICKEIGDKPKTAMTIKGIASPTSNTVNIQEKSMSSESETAFSLHISSSTPPLRSPSLGIHYCFILVFLTLHLF